MTEAVIILTERGGKDPDIYAVIVDPELFAELPSEDVWRTLGSYLDNEDPRVLTGTEFIPDEDGARHWCEERGISVKMIHYAEGY